VILFRKSGRPDTLPIPAATPDGASGGALTRVGILAGFIPHPEGNYGSLPLGVSRPGTLFRASDCQPWGYGVSVTTLIPWRSGTSPWIRTGASLYTMRPAPGVAGSGAGPSPGMSRAGAQKSSPPSVAGVITPRVMPIFPDRLAGARQGYDRG
jgi:hypothetical protein